MILFYAKYALYQGRCGAYDIPGKKGDVLAEKKFRENVELIVQEANDNVMKLLQNDNANLLNGVDIEKNVADAANKASKKGMSADEDDKEEDKEETKEETKGEDDNLKDDQDAKG